MSNIRVNTINDASGGSAAVLYGVASPPNSMGFRNRIINGGMVIDQRNAGASVTPAASTYTLDRWRFGCPSARMSVQQNAGSVTPPDGFRNYIGATTTSAYTPGAAEAFTIAQFIEGNNVADLMLGTANAKTFTLSFWVRSSLTGTFGAAFSNENGATRSYPFSYTISAANTWEFKTVTVTGDTSGTWGTTTGVGLGVFFSLGAGSNFVGTAGAWATGDLRTVSGATSVVGTNGATFYITGVQLEAGSVASPFERRDYGRELMMCQRYYEQGFWNQIFGYSVATNALARPFVPYLVQKRATGTTTFNDNNGNNGKIYRNGSNKTAAVHNQFLNGLMLTSSDNLSGGYDDIAFNWYTSSEL